MAWICNRCGYRINGGAHFDEEREHVCDPRSVVRVQSQQIISEDAQRELDSWLNVPWDR